jgi:hypothetical protein
VLHPGDAKLLSITDLFGDSSAALHALSSECQRQLEGRYEASLRQTNSDGKTLAAALKSMQEGVAHGTTPDAANFAVYLVDGIDSSSALVVVRTKASAASTVARALVEAGFTEVLGTLAGDDTVFVAPRRAGSGRALARRLRGVLGLTPSS